MGKVAVAGGYPSVRLCKRLGALPLYICLQQDYWPGSINNTWDAQRGMPSICIGAIFTVSHLIPTSLPSPLKKKELLGSYELSSPVF